jgi:hypothetical protein
MLDETLQAAISEVITDLNSRDWKEPVTSEEVAAAITSQIALNCIAETIEMHRDPDGYFCEDHHGE